jgi:hypothetical protein
VPTGIIWPTRRVHQSKTGPAHLSRRCSLGENRACSCRPGSAGQRAGGVCQEVSALGVRRRSSRQPQDLAPRSALLTAAEAHRVYDNCLHRWRIAQRFQRPDWSIVDLWVVRHCYRWAFPPLRSRTSFASAARGFPDSTAIPTTTCVAPSRAPLSLFPPQGALCDGRRPEKYVF